MINDTANSSIDSGKGVAFDHVSEGMDISTPEGKELKEFENNRGNVDWSGVDEKKTLRKMDLHVIPIVTILYLLNFLDRGNIGNAKIQGMPADLRLSGAEYNLCLTVFYFTYGVFEVPSNLILKKLTPSIWLPTIMIGWGVCTVCMGVVQNFGGLLSVRLLLGAFEAGLYPGVSYYLTTWYCTSELAFRQGMFFSAASMAGAFSGLLAYLIVKMDGVGGYAGWRWIFIIEGLLTVVVAIAAYFLIYDSPETASFFTEEERDWAVHRLKYQGSKGSNRMVAESTHFEWRFVKDCLTDWQIYVCIFMYWGLICPLYGISLFLPTIINQLGYIATTAQLLTIPIYVTAAILSVITCYFSDRAVKSGRSRSPYVFWPMIAVLVGFIIAISASAAGTVPGVVYAGVFIATCGMYPAFPGNITWIANNLAPSYKRAAGMAFHIGIGNLGGAFASNFYRTQDSPKFILGHGLEIAFITMGLIAVMILRVNYTRINKQRDASSDNGELLSEDELSRLGDKAPTFRYVL